VSIEVVDTYRTIFVLAEKLEVLLELRWIDGMIYEDRYVVRRFVRITREYKPGIAA